MTDDYVSDAFIYMRERRLPYPVFDADNHMYENRDALTMFLPPEYDGIIKYVDIGESDESRDQGQDKRLHSQPHVRPGRSPRRPSGRSPASTWNTGGRGVLRPRAPPGPDEGHGYRQVDDLAHAGHGRRGAARRRSRRHSGRAACLQSLDARTLDFNYADAMYPTPMISLSVLDGALKELSFVVENGAKAFLLHTAPVPTWKGRRSFALPEFDPFWEAVQEADILVGMHQTDSGYQRYSNEWEGLGNSEFRPFNAGIPGLNGSPAFLTLASEKSAIIDGVASIIGHGVANRFPRLRFAPTEFGTEWVRPLIRRMETAYDRSPEMFEEDPVKVFKRNIFVHAFQESDPAAWPN